MPLRLKQLDLHGYKTFATKTDFVFAEGISAIVGPNGSGKSNIVDSIRWVLGEQSFGLLRGKKTEDMIFAGSEQRPRAGMAQATLTFDNSDGWLPIEFSEVSIARRAYRDGENEYLLNGQRVRLRDISELLAKCGLAERNYTIIGQGLIDTALSLKAEERRALFEEAAGIGVYRNKREDALKKLDATQHNIERVLDILAELKPRLRSLERQAQRARDFNVIKADLHEVLKVWYGYHWHRSIEGMEQARVEAETLATDYAAMQTQQEGHNAQVTEVRARVTGARGQLNQWRTQLAQLRSESETITRDLAVADERVRSLTSQHATLLTELSPLEAQLAEEAEAARAATHDAERLHIEAAEARRQVEAAQTALAQGETERAHLRQNEATARAALNRLDGEGAAHTARHTQTLERRDRVATARAELLAALEQLHHAETSARALVLEANQKLNTAQQTRATAETRAAEQAEQVHHAENELAATVERATNARGHLERIQARHEILEQARAELAGFSAGAKTLLAKNFPTRGALAELLNVPPELETAISAALGNYLEALVVNDDGETLTALELLGVGNGRAAFLPLQRIAASEPLTSPEQPGVIGIAARLLSVDPILQDAVNLLLGRVLVVSDVVAAQTLLAAARHGEIIVTLRGEVFHAAGPVLAGTDAAPTTLQQARERRDLSAELDQARAALDRVNAEREAATRAVAEAKTALTQRQEELKARQVEERMAAVARDSAGLEAERVSHNVQFQTEQLTALDAETQRLTAEAQTITSQIEQLNAERQTAQTALETANAASSGFSLAAATDQLNQWQTAAAVTTRAAQDAQTRARELERARAATAKRLDERRARAAQLQAEAEAVTSSMAHKREQDALFQAQFAELHAQIAPAEGALTTLETDQTRIEADDSHSRTALSAAERRHAQAQLDLTRKNEELENLKRRIDEDFGLVEYDYGETASGPTPLPMYPIVEKLQHLDDLPEGLEEQLNRKRGQLRRMGLINPEAEKEYNDVKERHDFLTTQLADLETAQTQLREVIAEMDVLMERDFRKTFDAVANEFRDTFARLFGGGTAKLSLTDPDHLTTTGVDIQCKLPGKRPQTLSMLSGGERSLTACALVFALLRVAPTPFVVLDEVDAMLDEANVGRYRDMLHDLSGQTQFIVITHNRNTVQVADTVYGITMGADSASQVMGLKLDGVAIDKAPARPAPSPN